MLRPSRRACATSSPPISPDNHGVGEVRNDLQISFQGEGIHGLRKTAHSGNKGQFQVAGDYRIRVIVSDGALFPTYDIDVTFMSNPAGRARNLFWKAADRTGNEERLTTSEHSQYPNSWSPDGETLAFTDIDPVTLMDIWILSIKNRQTLPFLQTPFNEANLVFSADGHWVGQDDSTARKKADERLRQAEIQRDEHDGERELHGLQSHDLGLC